jgi:transcriptional regulator with XRE-family HTH domain
MLVKLINWEKENGYKAKYVAEKLGLSETQYSRIKQGHTKPSIEVAEKLEKVFKIRNVYDLLKNYEE